MYITCIGEELLLNVTLLEISGENEMKQTAGQHASVYQTQPMV